MNALLVVLITSAVLGSVTFAILHREIREHFRHKWLRAGSQVTVVSRNGEMTLNKKRIEEPEWFEGKIGTILSRPRNGYLYTYEVMFWDCPDEVWSVGIRDLRLVKR
jgi:hypothetical protein